MMRRQDELPPWRIADSQCSRAYAKYSSAGRNQSTSEPEQNQPRPAKLHGDNERHGANAAVADADALHPPSPLPTAAKTPRV
ncbi:hypothetical protein AJ79_04554 [Helicocarpus griseus UAMH5409]|uniref:Uncharacterized protein n=1 Tax=Helicocarpus griseus UAMH5409 TaxID=1447875 RepID=A0A2B7XU01_9EURO|nr:hypothetical protein AJ79_04554 [Helicocarpus griseus UAMH5409]